MWQVVTSFPSLSLRFLHRHLSGNSSFELRYLMNLNMRCPYGYSWSVHPTVVIVPWTTDLDPYLWCWLIPNFGDLTVRAAELIRFVFAQDLFMLFTLCMFKVWEEIFLLMRRIQYLVNTWLMSCIWSFISSVLYSDRRHVLYLPSHFLCTKYPIGVTHSCV